MRRRNEGCLESKRAAQSVRRKADQHLRPADASDSDPDDGVSRVTNACAGSGDAGVAQRSVRLVIFEVAQCTTPAQADRFQRLPGLLATGAVVVGPNRALCLFVRQPRLPSVTQKGS